MRLFHPGAVLTFTAIVQFALASKDDMPCVQGCVDTSCVEACIIKDGGHNIIDVANQPETGENDLSVENVPLLASESSTSMLPDEDDCDDDDDMTYDASKDEDCDDDDTPSEYAFDESKDDKEDCDEENERPLPYTTNSLSNTAAQVPTSPFATGGQGEARPTVTAYTTITSEIISPSAEMLHASSNIESDIVENNGDMMMAHVSISFLGAIPFALVGLL
ncbi:hypothetical protein LRAMOSA03316 [Lichtheimia ramosa]|uniref:Uncharacterized protein n=1 Tax=Lichtheimia ramosa TaxID=688394 RepID=A0A077WW97_9FUNG|nr:hypothetical protein LRAMOSA03316 [Lichtheimia ramosa]